MTIIFVCNGAILYCQLRDVPFASNGTREKIAEKENCYNSSRLENILQWKNKKFKNP